MPIIIDQVSLECADSRVPQALMGLLKNKDVLVGSVAVTDQRVETPEEVAATIGPPDKKMEYNFL